MAKILVINCGSSSIKYKLFYYQSAKDLKLARAGDWQNVEDYDRAIKAILRQIGDLRGLDLVAHRVVHGGEQFREPVLVDDEILSRLAELNDLAPLHNPYNLAGIKASKNYLPACPQVAVFDTGFYKTLPDYARQYALPLKLAADYGLYRYGFHGLSHEYVLAQAAAKLKKPVSRTNLISCHLGGGASITAIRRGRAVDTSMGLTPLEGLVMMTRPGDIDAGIVMRLFKIYENDFIQQSGGKVSEPKMPAVWDKVWHLLNHQSGIKGLSGLGDFRQLLREVGFGRQSAQQAFDLFVYRLVKYIGAYWAVLGGRVDALVFTGNIGAGDPITRRAVKRRLPSLKQIPVFAIQTNEEKIIAQKALFLLEKSAA